MIPTDSMVHRLTAAVIGEERAGHVLSVLTVDGRLAGGGGIAGRAQIAMALNASLLADLLDRVPTAAAYVARVAGEGRSILFDHGALRTVDGVTGALPSGHQAMARLLGPLGYDLAGVYPLPRLRMTGRAFVHRDLPEVVPQFFVSELHVAALPAEARALADRLFGASRDPLGAVELDGLALLARDGECPLETAVEMLPGLARAFGRHHPMPTLADYEGLLAHSAEAAWIATEGNIFNHATDRVPDVVALAAALKADGWPLKPEVEVSASGRVRQTAFLADKVRRIFQDADGGTAERAVPGSFYEFISRDIDPATGALDLSFDSGNATGIFTVTAAA